MIIVYHKNNKVVQLIRNGEELPFLSKTMVVMLLDLAQSYPQDWLIWCDIDLKPNLNLPKFESIFHHHRIMVSYGIADENYISAAIGYVEESPFIKVNKSVTYPTWLMSSNVGGIHASVLKEIGAGIKATNFNYFLNSLAKIGMPLGLFCYSDPRLLKQNTLKTQKRRNANHFSLFRFVSQHYKKRWLVLLFLNLLLFERRFPVIPFCYAWFFKSRKRTTLNLDAIPLQSSLKETGQKTIDVIIPTIGRKQYLYDVLKDLSRQTHMPQKVIIVEQNPKPESVSELDYLNTESWPFIIKHIFTHKAGACNARNLALAEVTGEWVFFNDDDNRFEKDFIEKFFQKVLLSGASVITTAYLQPNEIQHCNTVHQSGIFGSGNSIVKTTCLQNVNFDMALEFGYGEDTDFGMQLRNQGYDVIYFSDLKIIHLKAPVGGFRIEIKKQWELDSVQPKPSPTVMLCFFKNATQQQLNNYKTTLFFKYYRVQRIKNPIAYYRNFQKQWRKSIYWAEELKRNQ